MKISTRNQIKATVASMTVGMVNERITLLTSKGAKLSSVITSESAKEMSLKEGDTVTALFKATHVMLSNSAKVQTKVWPFKAAHVMLSAVHIDGISARNQLEGTIENVVKGMVSTEVTLVVEGGEHIVSIVTNEAAEELGVESGKKAVAIIKSSDIMIAK